ncbi:unnamed protein product, partial [Mesorhabditis spiculigera]
MTNKSRSKSQPPRTAPTERSVSRGRTAHSRKSNNERPPWNNDTTVDYNKTEIKSEPEYGRNANDEQEALNQSWMQSLRPDPLGRPAWNNDTTFDYEKHDIQPEPGRNAKEEQAKLNETWMSSLRGSFHPN